MSIDIKKLTSRGVTYFEKENYKEAIICFEKILENNNNNEQIWNLFNKVYLINHNFKKAIKFLEFMKVNSPNNLFIWNYLSMYYKKTKDYSKCIACYKRLIDLDSLKVEYWNLLLNLYLYLRKFDEAIDFFTSLSKAKDEIQDKPEIWNILGVLYSNKKNKKKRDYSAQAIEFFKRAISLKKDFLDSYRGLGALFRKQKKFDESILSYKQILKYDENCPSVWFNIGISQRIKGDWRNAIKSFSKAVTLDPDYIEAWEFLAYLNRQLIEAYKKHKNTSKIREHLDKLVIILEGLSQKDSLNIDIWNNLAESYLLRNSKGDKKKAKDCCERIKILKKNKKKVGKRRRINALYEEKNKEGKRKKDVKKVHDKNSRDKVKV